MVKTSKIKWALIPLCIIGCFFLCWMGYLAVVNLKFFFDSSLPPGDAELIIFMISGAVALGCAGLLVAIIKLVCDF